MCVLFDNRGTEEQSPHHPPMCKLNHTEIKAVGEEKQEQQPLEIINKAWKL